MKMSEIQHEALKHNGVTIALTVVGVAILWVTFRYFIEFSAFGVLLTKAAIGLALAGIVDNFVLYYFKTVEEIKSGNVAFAIVYFGFMLVIAAAIVSV